MNQNIIFIGFKKSGKSTLGLFLSKKLNYHFVDTDKLIEKTFDAESKLSYFEIYEKYGAEFFRKIERKVIHSLHGISKTVIATGGGSIIDQKNLQTLKSLGKFVYLYLPEELLKKRIEGGRIPPFLLSNFDRIYRQRDAIYQSIADLTINLKTNSLDKAKKDIMKFFKHGK